MMGITDAADTLEHFGCGNTHDGAETHILSKKSLGKLGRLLEMDFAKRKGRAVIHYDSAYPFMVLEEIFTDSSDLSP